MSTKIDSGMEDAFSRFDKLQNDAEIETLMKVIGEIRVRGAAFGRVVDRKDNLLSDIETDAALEQQQKELRKPHSVFFNVCAGMAEAGSHVAGTDLLKFTAKALSAGLGGCGGYMGQAQQSDLAPLQARVQALQNRAMMGRQETQSKQGEMSQALQGKERDMQSEHDAKSQLMR